MRLLRDWQGRVEGRVEGSPKGLDVERMIAAIREVGHVEAVHDIHVWTVSDHLNFLSAHVEVSDARTMEECGAVIRDVNEVPAAVVVVLTQPAPTMSSFAAVVVADPLLAVAAVPLAPAVRSRMETPEYSRMRTSGNATAALNVTVTVGLEAGPPPVMLLA